jgi:hypothetical protein
MDVEMMPKEPEQAEEEHMHMHMQHFPVFQRDEKGEVIELDLRKAAADFERAEKDREEHEPPEPGPEHGPEHRPGSRGRKRK